MCSQLSATALSAAAMVVCIAAPSTFAAPIAVFSTGGASAGSVDPNYVLSHSGDTTYAGPAAYVETSIPGNYAGDDSTSSWIGPAANGSTSVGTSGPYEYDTTFNLAGLNPATAVLTGAWASDNTSTIYLNGVNTGISLNDGNYGGLTPFTISTGFVGGVNQLEFFVTNLGGPSALRVAISGTASTVPEPATLGLLAGGFVLLRRRR